MCTRRVARSDVRRPPLARPVYFRYDRVMKKQALATTIPLAIATSRVGVTADPIEVTVARAHVEQVQTKTFSKQRPWIPASSVDTVLALGATTAVSASSSGSGGGGIQP